MDEVCVEYAIERNEKKELKDSPKVYLVIKTVGRLQMVWTGLL